MACANRVILTEELHRIKNEKDTKRDEQCIITERLRVRRPDDHIVQMHTSMREIIEKRKLRTANRNGYAQVVVKLVYTLAYHRTSPPLFENDGSNK